METRKYRVRTACLSCSKSISGIAVIVVRQLPEDDGEERAFIVHEGCQNSLVRNLPYRNLTDQNTATGRPRFGTDRSGTFRSEKRPRVPLPQPAGNLSNVHQAAGDIRQRRHIGRSAKDRTAPRISAPRGPGHARRTQTGNVPQECQRASPWPQRKVAAHPTALTDHAPPASSRASQ